MSLCLVVGAASSSHKALDFILEAVSYDAIVAADGGYETLKQRNIEPYATFGDFDSLGYIPNTPRLMTFDTHKDYTDLDLALQWVQKEGFDQVILCDCLSARLDHSIGNLQLLIKYAKEGLCIGGATDAEMVVPLVAPGPFSALGFVEGAWGTLSVMSHSDKAYGVSEYGLEYGIEDALCSNDALWGISNELIGKSARISLSKGSLWVFFPLKEIMKCKYGA